MMGKMLFWGNMKEMVATVLINKINLIDKMVLSPATSKLGRGRQVEKQIMKKGQYWLRAR